MNDIEILEEFIKHYKEVQEKYKDAEIQAEIERSCYFEEVPAEDIENLIKENKELKEKLEEKDMQHELELIGKEEYTKDAMGEIIEHYYTANEDCIPKSKVKEKIEQLKLVKNTPVKDNKYTYKECIEYGIEELQELLEGE